MVASGCPPLLRRLLAGSPLNFSAVISFGIAGGLDASLAPGHVVIANGIMAGGQRWPTDPGIVRLWGQLLEDRRERVTAADVAGAETPVLSVHGKSALRIATGAAAVDTESHIAAQFAASRALPFAAIRVVCDSADRELPSLIMTAMDADGSLDLAAILASLARRPLQMAALPRLARDARLAFARLSRVGAALGPGFSLGLLGLGQPRGDVP